MGFHPDSVHPTAHWADEKFYPREDVRTTLSNIQVGDKVVLFTGRVSHEKGVMELPEILNELRKTFPEIKLVIAGTGPAERELREAIPEAIFLGWVDHSDLPIIYSSADILVLPSKFDTFSCVVLEALSCGLPVIAYKTKGPKDIIEDGINGYLVNSNQGFILKLKEYFSDVSLQKTFRTKALERALKYNKEKIIQDLLYNVGIRDGFSSEKES
jgi:glycosyltransferase involved in cell wall biosynthesis